MHTSARTNQERSGLPAASVRALMHEGAAAGLPHADAVAQRLSEFH